MASELQRVTSMPPDGLPRTQVVLLVDDDLRTTRRLAEMLREDGLTVEIARDGAAAIARFTHTQFPMRSSPS